MKTTTLTTLPGVERFPAFSPDGKLIAFSHWNQEKGNMDIHVQIIGTHESRSITNHPANDGLPNWSPDGRHIAFLRWWPEQRAEGIFMIPALGGTEQKISSVARDFHLTDVPWPLWRGIAPKLLTYMRSQSSAENPNA
jgi:Tol biopolymer transport system component